jgi:hypothetical protein
LHNLKEIKGGKEMNSKLTIAEAIEECYDAMISFHKTLYGWVMGRIEEVEDER